MRKAGAATRKLRKLTAELANANDRIAAMSGSETDRMSLSEELRKERARTAAVIAEAVEWRIRYDRLLALFEAAQAKE